MNYGSLESIFYIFSFLVPGFIFDAVFSAMIPRRKQAWERSLLHFFVLSCVNYALWSWLIYLVIKIDFFTQHPIRSMVAWLVIILFSPLLFGMLLGRLSQSDLIRKILEGIGIYLVHPIPNSWDYFFGKTEPKWVLVTLKNGSTVGGFWGSESFASSDPEERDLYIEKVYKINEDGPWSEVNDSEGIWLSASEIKHIEFRAVTRKEQ